MPILNKKDLLDTQPYISIVNLIQKCKMYHPDFKGLSFSHFIYALMENPEMSRDKKNEMEKYFEQIKGKKIYDSKGNFVITIPVINEIFSIEKGVLKNKQRLTEKLNTLIKNNIIKPDKKTRNRKYNLSKDFDKIWWKTAVIKEIEKMDIVSLQELSISIHNKKNKIKPMTYPLKLSVKNKND